MKEISKKPMSEMNCNEEVELIMHYIDILAPIHLHKTGITNCILAREFRFTALEDMDKVNVYALQCAIEQHIQNGLDMARLEYVQDGVLRRV